MVQTPRSPSRPGLLVGGAAWILTLLYFVGQIIAQAAWRAPYSLIDNRVSDLGSTSCGSTVANSYICSPLHAVMNATFILTGVLILGGLYLTRPVRPRRKLSTWGLILLGIAGAGTILIGLSPENVNVLLHLIGALNIPAGNAAMILLGLVIWHDRRWPRFAPWFSVALGAIGFLGLLGGLFMVILTGHGGGLAERIALYPLIIWLIVFGLLFVQRGLRSGSDQEDAVAARAEPIDHAMSAR
jgi:hypothetical membrane protein